ncbi:zinc finger, CCHC-type containing protein [Tanacetum coccineum]|uniref:Zinc finger, CCHC-type containing protein n=1 Tax=Tanacetum coccineum TaxID=301880 RepID=A0ABQ5FKW4_9ASTR
MAQLLMYSLLFAVAFTGSESGKKRKKVHRGRARKEAEERCTLTLELSIAKNFHLWVFPNLDICIEIVDYIAGMIVDDEFVSLGSANINYRSPEGTSAMGAYQSHQKWARKGSNPSGQGSLAKAKFHVNYKGTSLIEPLQKLNKTLTTLHLRIVLSVEDKLDYLEQPIPLAPVPAQAGQQVAPEALAAHTAWVKGSKEIDGFILMTMESDIQRNLENLSAYDMFQELKTLFAQQAEQELLQNVRDFHYCKQEEGQSVSSYVIKMKSYIDNLERLGHPVSLNLGVSLILISLRNEFDSFVQNYNMHSMGKTVNELHAMLKLHEQTLPKKDPALHVIRAGKVQKKNNKTKETVVGC